MNIILLSGGSGQRLWPLPNDIRSKQFIKIFKTKNGYESMIQRMYRMISECDPDSTVTIATSKAQVSEIHNQLGDKVHISLEPCRKDTFPAIALATAYLHDVVGLSESEVVVVCPVDPYVDSDYFKMLHKLGDYSEKSDSNLVLMGVEPTYPSEKYGYIIPSSSNEISTVSMFKEKPNAENAKAYIEKGALWNAGVFAYHIGFVLEKAHELIDFKDYNQLFSMYSDLEKISFDYAVVEKEPKIEVMRYAGQWKDLGTWNTFTEAMSGNTIGNVILDDTCTNVNVINELKIPILCMGLKDTVVAASPQGILVTDKEQSGYMKPYVNQINQQVMFSERSWGTYQVLDIQNDSQTILVSMKANSRMSYHSHDYRDEVWTVLSGTGMTIIDGVKNSVSSGDIISIKSGTKHTIIAETELKLIEVQFGADIDVHDKHKYSVQ